MAMPNATPELDSVVEQSQVVEIKTQPAARRASRADERREALARYVATRGDDTPSNFEAMVRVLERDPNAGADPCPDCDGLGFRPLSPELVAEYDQKLENRLIEIERLRRNLAEYEADAFKPRNLLDADDEKLRKNAVRDADDTRAELIKIHDNMDEARRERVKRSICRTCHGSAKSERRRREGRQGRPDSMFSTVSCPGCLGVDARKHSLLQTRHYGSSSGGAFIHGNRIVVDPKDPNVYEVVSDHRDDAAAERGDTCKRCHGAAYLEPITCRPTRRAGDVEEDLELQQVRTVRLDGHTEELREGELDHYPAHDFAPAAGTGDPAGDWLEEVAAEDLELAAAIAVLVGEHGDKFAKTPWGRRFALWPLTSAGKRLAMTSKLQAAGDGYERVLKLCALERQAARKGATASPLRAILIAQADQQARLIEARAEARLAA